MSPPTWFATPPLFTEKVPVGVSVPPVILNVPFTVIPVTLINPFDIVSSPVLFIVTLEVLKVPEVSVNLAPEFVLFTVTLRMVTFVLTTG
jgi:hypothetical protein